MGRWRPPQPPSAPYITPEGYAALEQEQKALWLRRRDVVQALSEAAAEGDRSENAEYIYRKKELGGIDRRIRYIQKRLPVLQVVPPRMDTDKVFFGAWVTLHDGDARATYRIVGADEIDADKGWISVDSPVAKALLGQSADCEVTVNLGTATQHVTIEAVRYEGSADDTAQQR
ncbi:MAG: GreA/GreB family elongation factor [Pseudomonadota bacterium]